MRAQQREGPNGNDYKGKEIVRKRVTPGAGKRSSRQSRLPMARQFQASERRSQKAVSVLVVPVKLVKATKKLSLRNKLSNLTGHRKKSHLNHQIK